MINEESDNELCPRDGRPLQITSCNGNAVRARLIEIANKNQLTRRKNNSIHIQLFDRIKIGRLNRTEIDIMENGLRNEISVEDGYFLCNRNNKDILIYHSELKKPTCKKCIRVANRLLNKGLKIFLLDLDTWNELQNISLDNQVRTMVKNIDLSLFKEMNELMEKHIRK